jgi:hypothetical protein
MNPDYLGALRAILTKLLYHFGNPPELYQRKGYVSVPDLEMVE